MAVDATARRVCQASGAAVAKAAANLEPACRRRRKPPRALSIVAAYAFAATGPASSGRHTAVAEWETSWCRSIRGVCRLCSAANGTTLRPGQWLFGAPVSCAPHICLGLRATPPCWRIVVQHQQHQQHQDQKCSSNRTLSDPAATHGCSLLPTPLAGACAAVAESHTFDLTGNRLLLLMCTHDRTHQVHPCTYSCVDFPVGACGVLGLCMLALLSVAAWGVTSNDIARDVNPNVDGIEPRGTEIGRRDNTLKLLLFDDQGAEELHQRSGVCLGHTPSPHCGRRRLELFAVEQQQMSAGTLRSAGPPSPAATNRNVLRRALQSEGAEMNHSGSRSNICGAPGNGGCTRRMAVIFGARNGGNVLTASMLRGMCAWEEQFHQYASFADYCEPSAKGGCCFAPSIARAVAHVSGVPCAELTDSQASSVLRSLVHCASLREQEGANLHNMTECQPLMQTITADVDIVTLAVGDGPAPGGVWDPVSTHRAGGFPLQCGDFHARCRSRGNGDWRRGLVAEPFGQAPSLISARWAASSICVRGEKKPREAMLLKAWFDKAAPAYEDPDEDSDWQQELIALPSPHGIYIKINQHYIFQDLTWAGFSFLLVYGYIIVSTGSVFVATLGMAHIFLSFFVTYALYKHVLVWFPFLLWLGLFVICGIGADDIFVFVDAWAQAGKVLPSDTPLAARITWAHNRAAGAMLITSLTTAGAFASNTVSAVIPVCLFGGFMCLLVLINYLAVIGMFPAVVVLDHCWTEHRKRANKRTGCCCGLAPAMHRLLLSLCPFARKRERLGVQGTHAIQDSALDQRETESVDGITHGSHSNISDKQSSTVPHNLTDIELRLVERLFARYWAPHVTRAAKLLVPGFAILTVVVLFAYTVQMHKATTQLEIWPQNYMARRYDRVMSEGWPNHFVTEYGCEPECEDVAFVFGAVASDTGSAFAATWPKNEDHLQLDRGTLSFDPEFSLQSERAQLWLLNFTANARRLPMFTPRAAENSVVLPTDTDPAKASLPTLVIEAALQPGPMWSVNTNAFFQDPNDLTHVVNLGGGCRLGPGFSRCFDDYVRDAAKGFTPTAAQTSMAAMVGKSLPDHVNGITIPSLVYDTKGLRALGVVLHSTLDGSEHGRWDYTTRSSNWALLQAFLMSQIAGEPFSFCAPKKLPSGDARCLDLANAADGPTCAAAEGGGVCKLVTLPPIGAAPAGFKTGWFHAPWFVTTDLQATMVVAALESGAIAVLLAGVCLAAATRSVRMTALALVAIFSTLVLVVGWLVALGWSLGVLESMCMAISVGICVDFICHAAHAYSHAPYTALSRADCTQHALTEMGVSIFSAFATTFTAAVVLLLATTVVFFTEFGVFLAICMVCSVTVSLVYFPALLALAGPLPSSLNAAPGGDAAVATQTHREVSPLG